MNELEGEFLEIGLDTSTFSKVNSFVNIRLIGQNCGDSVTVERADQLLYQIIFGTGFSLCRVDPCQTPHGSLKKQHRTEI